MSFINSAIFMFYFFTMVYNSSFKVERYMLFSFNNNSSKPKRYAI